MSRSTCTSANTALKLKIKWVARCRPVPILGVGRPSCSKAELRQRAGIAPQPVGAALGIGFSSKCWWACRRTAEPMLIDGRGSAGEGCWAPCRRSLDSTRSTATPGQAGRGSGGYSSASWAEGFPARVALISIGRRGRAVLGAVAGARKPARQWVGVPADQSCPTRSTAALLAG